MQIARLEQRLPNMIYIIKCGCGALIAVETDLVSKTRSSCRKPF